MHSLQRFTEQLPRARHIPTAGTLQKRARLQFCPRMAPSFVRKALTPFYGHRAAGKENQGKWDPGLLSLHPECFPHSFPHGLLEDEARTWLFETGKAKAEEIFTVACLPVLTPPALPRSVFFDLLGLCICRFGGRFRSLAWKRGLRRPNYTFTVQHGSLVTAIETLWHQSKIGPSAPKEGREERRPYFYFSFLPSFPLSSFIFGRGG